jgi:hypothetical protein
MTTRSNNINPHTAPPLKASTHPNPPTVPRHKVSIKVSKAKRHTVKHHHTVRSHNTNKTMVPLLQFLVRMEMRSPMHRKARVVSRLMASRDSTRGICHDQRVIISGAPMRGVCLGIVGSMVGRRAVGMEDLAGLEDQVVMVEGRRGVMEDLGDLAAGRAGRVDIRGGKRMVRKTIVV